MIGIVDLYNRFTSLVNTFQGGFFRPQTDFEKSANNVNMDIWKYYTAMAEKTQEVTDYLAPFTIIKNVTVTSQGKPYGTAKYPTDYARFASAAILVKGEATVPCLDADADIDDKVQAREDYLDDVEEFQVDKIDNSRWASYTSHLTKGPKLDNPGMVQKDGEFRVMPRSVSVIVLTYYKEPDYVKFLYTVAPGDIQTGAGEYIIPSTPNGEFLWGGTLINEFLWRLGEFYSIFTKDQFLNQAVVNHERINK